MGRRPFPGLVIRPEETGQLPNRRTKTLFVIDPKLASLCLIPIPVISVMVYLLRRSIRDRAERRQAQYSEMSAIAHKVMSKLTSEVKDNDSYVTFKRSDVEIMHRRIDAIRGHLLHLESCHVERCDECSRVIQSYNLKMNKHGRVTA